MPIDDRVLDAESTTTRTAVGLDFTAIGGKKQGREVPQSLKTTRWNRVLCTRFGKPKNSDTTVFHLQNDVRNSYTVNLLILKEIQNAANFDVWEPYRFPKSSFGISMPTAINFHSSVPFRKLFLPHIQTLNPYLI